MLDWCRCSEDFSKVAAFGVRQQAETFDDRRWRHRHCVVVHWFAALIME
jgi:hypothetical protein